MVVGIVVTHGNLAEELLETARQVYGEFTSCFAVSNTSKSPQGLVEELQSVVKTTGAVPCLIFVDFVGGSCGHACLKTASDRPRTLVISGVNLPMILAFLNKRDEVPFEKLTAAVIERSHDSIKVFDPSSIDAP